LAEVVLDGGGDAKERRQTFLLIHIREDPVLQAGLSANIIAFLSRLECCFKVDFGDEVVFMADGGASISEHS
jgi:hypothetical protein